MEEVDTLTKIYLAKSAAFNVLLVILLLVFEVTFGEAFVELRFKTILSLILVAIGTSVCLTHQVLVLVDQVSKILVK